MKKRRAGQVFLYLQSGSSMQKKGISASSIGRPGKVELEKNPQAIPKSAISAANSPNAVIAAKQPKNQKSISQIKDISQIKSTADVAVSDALIDQVIGQNKAIEVIKKAAIQKRNVLLVGTPGTGKSMLAQAMAELMPIEELSDIVVTANREDDNMPKVKILKAGEGRKIISGERMQTRMTAGNTNYMMIGFMMLSMMIGLYILPKYFSDVIVAAMLIGMFLMGAALVFGMTLGRGRMFDTAESMKLIVDNSGKKKAPFVDATGSRAGALLGDVKHDPFQSFDGKTKIELNGSQKSMEDAWKEYSGKFPVERRDDGYESIIVPKKAKAKIKARKGKKIAQSRLLIINRRPYGGKLVGIKVGKKGTLFTTPEHAYISNPSEKRASKLRKGMKVFAEN
ncbi:MAG: ATP-binding protein [Candidatus Micrarchaeota archaeon]